MPTNEDLERVAETHFFIWPQVLSFAILGGVPEQVTTAV
jgi:hypothetical protein